MWEFAADLFRNDGFEQALQRVRNPDFTTFDETENSIFTTEIDVRGKSVIQVGCNNGTELICLKKKGAGQCVGIDISEGFIGQARALANAAEADVAFECTNIFDIRSSFFGRFDLVYITVGVLGWMPELMALFGIISRLLRPRGRVFIYEQHPILGMFNPEPPHPMDAAYFRKEPFRDEIVPEYIDKEGKHKAVSYWFPHTLGEILTCCMAHQLGLTHFKEYPKDVSDTYKRLENHPVELPMSFTLIAQK